MTRDPSAGPKTRLKSWVHTTPRFRCPSCGANLSVQEGVSWVQAKLHGKPPFDPSKVVDELDKMFDKEFPDKTRKMAQETTNGYRETAEGDSDG